MKFVRIQRAALLLTGLFMLGCGPALGPQISRLGGLTPAVPPGTDMPEMQALMREGAARMVLRIPQRNVAVTLLAAGMRDGVIRWRSTDNSQIHTRDGMIIATRGLGDDLMTVDTADGVSLILSGGPGRFTRIHRRLDGEDRMEIQSWICDVLPAGQESVQVSETESRQAQRVDETCHSPRGPFTNTHWIFAGEILQSRQYAGPALGHLQVLFLP